MNLYLKHLIGVMETLRDGISVYVKDLGREIIVKSVMICGTCDLPASAICLNMAYYNGTWGCHKCLSRIQRVGNTNVYTQVPEYELRTYAQTEQYVKNAVDRQRCVFGVKGPSVFRSLIEDYIRMTVLDSMHMVSGVSKMLLCVWFGTKLKHHAASLFAHLKTVDSLLCSITPPSYIKRMPRTITDVSYWKASELITWLLVYSLPVLHGIMSEEYFLHHQLLVAGLYHLYKDGMTHDDIETGRILLNCYVRDFEKLYTSRLMTCNLHSLAHLWTVVRDYGPLHITSCFDYENLNGIMKNVLHATRDAQFQICASLSSYMQLASLKAQYLEPNSTASDYCDKVEKNGTHRSKLSHIAESTSVMGAIKVLKIVPPWISELLDECQIHGTSIYEFHRLMQKGITYASKNYSRAVKINSTCVEYLENNAKQVGFVENFIRVSRCSCADSYCNECADDVQTFAIISKYESSNPFKINHPEINREIPLTFVQKVNLHGTRTLSVLPVSALISVHFCLKLQNSDAIYAVKSVTL